MVGDPCETADCEKEGKVGKNVSENCFSTNAGGNGGSGKSKIKKTKNKINFFFSFSLIVLFVFFHRSCLLSSGSESIEMVEC